MGQAYKVLGQSAPAATTATTLYTCPGSTQTIVSSIFVCNRGSTATTFRIWIDVNGAGDDAKDYIYYDMTIPASDTFLVTAGLTIDASDLIRVYAGNANLSFSAFGVEIT